MQNVGSAKTIVVNVDAVPETISFGDTEIVNGLKITNFEAFYDNDPGKR